MKIKMDVNHELMWLEEYGEPTFFIQKCGMLIVDDGNKVIGEIKGYTLNKKSIIRDFMYGEGKSVFFELDGISQLCYLLFEFMDKNYDFMTGSNGMYFLNRISFHREYATVENDRKGLELLIQAVGDVVYSWGSTELSDDFPESPYESYDEEHEEMLLNNGWKFDEENSFYYKKESM